MIAQINPDDLDHAFNELPPGGHVACITEHPSVDGIRLRLAGFELRDVISWHSITGYRHILLGRKWLDRTIIDTVLTHGAGALHIDACRVGATGGSQQPSGWARINERNHREGYRPSPYPNSRDPREALSAKRDLDRGTTNFAPLLGVRGGSPKGRFPANVVLDPDQAAALDQQPGILTSGSAAKGGHKRRRVGGAIYGGGKGFTATFSVDAPAGQLYGDTGGASRFFTVTDDAIAWLERLLGIPTTVVEDSDRHTTRSQA